MMSPFPPSFADNPMSYGMALFSMTLCSALAAAMLSRFWFEARARKAAWRLAANPNPEPMPFATPLTVHRAIISSFLVMVFIGVTPDALVLLFWGEADARTMRFLFDLDRVLDGLTFIPFVTAVGLSIWGMQVIPQKLVTEVKVTLHRPKWETLRAPSRVVVAVSLIAIGVTFAKATQ